MTIKTGSANAVRSNVAPRGVTPGDARQHSVQAARVGALRPFGIYYTFLHLGDTELALVISGYVEHWNALLMGAGWAVPCKTEEDIKPVPGTIVAI
eukprot:2689947-Rhodomonas_salina.1